jgi:two-component system, NtrC family, sensor histidine kinase KinB
MTDIEPESEVMETETAAEQTARSSLELLFEIGREVASALDLRTVIHRVLFLSMKNVGAISGSIIVLDDNLQPTEAAFLMHGQVHDNTVLQLKMTYEHGLAGWVARHRQAVLIPDTSQDERWFRRPDDASDRTGPKSAVSVPILAREKLVGVITLVHPQPGFFTTDHLELGGAIADQAGFAIRNAQLYERLQAAHRRYRDLFEDSIDPILITNNSGRILETNRQAETMLALNRDELALYNIRELHLMDLEIVGSSFDRLPGGETVSYEAIIQPRLGRKIPVQVYVRSIVSDGEVNLQWILRDISERKDLDRLREDLNAMVYHDLRSPLANVVSSLDVLAGLLENQEDPTITSLLKIAIRSTERVQRLTYSLLDLNRLEAGQAIGERHAILVRPLVEETIEAILPSADARNIEVITSVQDEPVIFADMDMIRRVLINLAENAVKFSPSNTSVSIRAQPEGDFVRLSVSDIGPGIPAEDQERIFEKFTRLNVKEGPRGLGLGLAFCRLAVEGHGGKIWVESQAGQGSTFYFTIPVQDPAEQPDHPQTETTL